MMNPTCRHCERAEVQQWSIFNAACVGCRARGIARSPQFFRADRDQVQGREYRDLLVRAQVTHDQVKAARAGDFESADER